MQKSQLRGASQLRMQEGRGVQKARRKKLSLLQEKMAKKLVSANFRMINESLYSTTSTEAKALMDEKPDLFHLYHKGYAEQVKRWPRNPLDDVIKFLCTQRKSLRIADLGCGEGRLARAIPQQVKSFDLVATNKDVIACDIAKLPLPDSSINVAVFCLSLMGTNYEDFLHEAYRIVVPSGVLIVVEVASRFPNHDPQSFVNGVESIGFRLDRHHQLMAERSGGGRSSFPTKGKQKRRTRRLNDAARESNYRDNDRDAFFFKFVFTSKKNGCDEKTTGQTGKLPKLAACMYKKR